MTLGNGQVTLEEWADNIRAGNINSEGGVKHGTQGGTTGDIGMGQTGLIRKDRYGIFGNGYAIVEETKRKTLEFYE